MFLATTALKSFWDAGQEILFLGTWCLPYEQQSEWEHLDHSVLPSLWDDRERWHSTLEYLEQRYGAALNDLAEYLNSVHGVSHQTRYWRILLGPWLRRFLHTVYDRYAHLVEAFAQHPDLTTYVLDPEGFQFSADTAGFSRSVRLDEFNLMIFSQILKAQGYDFPSRQLAGGWLDTEEMPSARPNSLTRRFLRSGKRTLGVMEDWATALVGRSRPIALCGMYLRSSEVWSLALRSGLKAAPLELKNDWSTPPPVPSRDSKREGLASLPAPDDFSRVFAQLLTDNFPTLFLEGYEAARADTLRRHPKFPKVLTSLTGWYFDEPFKFLAAEASEKGSRLVASQHGGLYGIGLSVPEESHEKSISDTYLVWGWAENGSRPSTNMPTPKLAPAIDIHHRNNGAKSDGEVLFVTVTGPRYSVKFITIPVGSQMVDYFDWELRFLGANTERLRRKIIFRPLRIDFGWGLKKRISDKFPDVNWDDGRPFRDRLKSSCIVVIDNPVTTFLEALVANVPTILFWNRERWEFRAEAEPHFESLRQAGILWDSPEEAAAKLESVYDDPWVWWGSDAVQETRKNFVSRYALSSKDWARHWAKTLKDEADLYQAVNA